MGKGGSTSSTVAVPEYIEKAARRNLTEADKIRRLGFIPEYGPTVAAFTPTQEAAFQGTAQAAGAFGLPGGEMSMQDISGGMPEPTTYAGGVRGYSALPIYEQALEAFGQARPGQKQYIDRFFIDPFTGLPGSNMQAPVDYTVASTPGDLGGISAGGGGGVGAGVGAGAGAGQVPSSTITQEETMQLGDVVAPGSGYNPVTDILTDEQRAYVNDPANVDARIAQEDLAMSITGDANSNIIDAGKGLLNIEPSFDSPSSAGSYGGSLVTGGLSGNLTGIPASIADNILSSAAPEYAIGLQGQNFAEAGGSTYDPNMAIKNKITGGTTTGGYDFDPNAFSSDYGSANFEFSDLTPVPEPAPVGFTSLPNTGMTAIPGYTTPLPTTFVNDYSDPATLAKFEADRAPGGIFYESSGQQRREAEERAAVKAKDDALAQSVDTSEVLNLAKSKNSAQQWLKENGYGNYDKDDATDILRSKVADIEKSQLQQGLKDGVVMENDRYSVYVNGQLVSSEKRSSEAKARLKAATS